MDLSSHLPSGFTSQLPLFHQVWVLGKVTHPLSPLLSRFSEGCDNFFILGGFDGRPRQVQRVCWRPLWLSGALGPQDFFLSPECCAHLRIGALHTHNACRIIGCVHFLWLPSQINCELSGSKQYKPTLSSFGSPTIQCLHGWFLVEAVGEESGFPAFPGSQAFLTVTLAPPPSPEPAAHPALPSFLSPISDHRLEKEPPVLRIRVIRLDPPGNPGSSPHQGP